LESFTETRSTADAVQPSSSTMSNSSALVRIRSFEESGSTVDISTNSLTSKINNPTVTKTLFSADFGHNPWDFDVKPDDDFVNQVLKFNHLIIFWLFIRIVKITPTIIFSLYRLKYWKCLILNAFLPAILVKEKHLFIVFIVAALAQTNAPIVEELE